VAPNRCHSYFSFVKSFPSFISTLSFYYLFSFLLHLLSLSLLLLHRPLQGVHRGPEQAEIALPLRPLDRVSLQVGPSGFARICICICSADPASLVALLGCKLDKINPDASNLPKHPPLLQGAVPGSTMLWQVCPF
jgi:hypothetical protein